MNMAETAEGKSASKSLPKVRLSLSSFYGVLGFVVVIALWYGIVALGIVRKGLLPTPDEVFTNLVDRLVNGGLLFDIAISLQRVVIGVAAGLVVAVPIGFALGWYASVRKMFNPLVNFFRALPPIALVPLVIVYFGIGEFAKTIILVYAAFFTTIIIIYEGIVSIDTLYVRAARTLGASQLEIFYKVVLPLSVPNILTAARVSIGIAWASLVAAELVAAQRGLGSVIQNASNFLDIPTVYGGIILIGLAALVMDNILRLISARLVSWQGRSA